MENQKNQQDEIRGLITILVLLLIGLISLFLLSKNFLLGILFFFVSLFLFLITGFKVIPYEPPHKGVLVFLGKRRREILQEGLNWLPLYSVSVCNFIPIKVEKINYDLKPQEVRTPDRAMISVQASITFVPGIEGEPDSYITYLNSGGEEGVKKIISDIIEDRIKTWAASNREGPSGWMEALALRDDVHEVLVKALLRGSKDWEPIDSPIPTNTWMRFFESPQIMPTHYDIQNGWGQVDKKTGKWNWNGLQKIYDSYDADTKEKLREQIKKRKEIIHQIREGRGNFGDTSLGITIIRFTVNEIKVVGEVAKAAELEEKEERERAADAKEIQNIAERVADLREKHPDLSVEDALKLIQVERGKATRTIIDISGTQTSIGNDLLGLAGVIKAIMEGSSKGGFGQGGQGNQGVQSTSQEGKKTGKTHREISLEAEQELRELQGE